jgi:hypothetical protein
LFLREKSGSEEWGGEKEGEKKDGRTKAGKTRAGHTTTERLQCKPPEKQGWIIRNFERGSALVQKVNTFWGVIGRKRG